MKRILLAISILSLSAAIFARDDAKDVPKPILRPVAIDAKLVESYTAAQKRTFEAQQAVEKTPEWGVLMVRQSQEQSALLFIMAESGLKPTEGCQPVFDEKTHALLRFDCPEKKSGMTAPTFEKKP
jgi:hypothetical protein